MTPDTPVCVYSASKAMAAMAVHLLSEQKQLSLLDPVSHYVPAFGQNGKRDITIYQLLCHKAGIPTVPTDGDDVAELLLDQHRTLDLIYRSAPDKPGQHHAYHALTAGFVIADLVEKVSGQRFRSFFREHISGPMQLATFDFGARGRTLQRLARNYSCGFRFDAPVDYYLRRAIGTTLEHAVALSNDPRFYRAVIPSGNGVATADECSRFFQCLLDGGKLGGRRVFQPLTVRRAVAEVGKPEIDRSLLLPLRYSAGMMLGASPFGMFGPDTLEGVRAPRFRQQSRLGRPRARHGGGDARDRQGAARPARAVPAVAALQAVAALPETERRPSRSGTSKQSAWPESTSTTTTQQGER